MNLIDPTLLGQTSEELFVFFHDPATQSASLVAIKEFSRRLPFPVQNELPHLRLFSRWEGFDFLD